MKNYETRIKRWLFPQPDKTAEREIDRLNINSLYYISLVICIVQIVTLAIFLSAHFDELSDISIANSVTNVSFCILLCLAGFLISGYFRRRSDNIDRHMAINVFVGMFFTMLIVWGMVASIITFIDGRQIITFFITEMAAVLFVKLKPMVTAAIILSTYIIFYVILNFGIRSGMINLYNYLMMAAISVAGAIIDYRLTLNYIEQKNRANQLNESLEIIASHDSMTRLQNRYALNQCIPDYLDKDICVAMGDIDHFKNINDTCGHQTGDDTLKSFADILQKHFDHEDIYRYGGDEFLIITSGDDLDGLRDTLRNINEEFGRTKISGLDVTPSCSFGCQSAHPIDQKQFFELISDTDNKLYSAKDKKDSAGENIC